MMLSEIEPGVVVRVTLVNGDERISKRLMEMGIVPGVNIKVIKSAPFGDPIEVKILGYNLALRKNEANYIEVDLMKGGAS
jgi:ferrous iron transport protein A